MLDEDNFLGLWSDRGYRVGVEGNQATMGRRRMMGATIKSGVVLLRGHLKSLKWGRVTSGWLCGMVPN